MKSAVDPKVKSPAGTRGRDDVIPHALEAAAEAKGVISKRVKGIVICLDGCPIEIVLRWRLEPAAKIGEASDDKARSGTAGNAAERRIRGQGIQSRSCVGNVGDVAAYAAARSVDERRGEYVCFLKEIQLPVGVGEEK